MEETNERIAEIFVVLVSAHGQYSIWPALKKTPLGWRRVGIEGNKSKCMKYIEENWTDMNPKN